MPGPISPPSGGAAGQEPLASGSQAPQETEWVHQVMAEWDHPKAASLVPSPPQHSPLCVYNSALQPVAWRLAANHSL